MTLEKMGNNDIGKNRKLWHLLHRKEWHLQKSEIMTFSCEDIFTQIHQKWHVRPNSPKVTFSPQLTKSDIFAPTHQKGHFCPNSPKVTFSPKFTKNDIFAKIHQKLHFCPNHYRKFFNFTLKCKHLLISQRTLYRPHNMQAFTFCVNSLNANC